VLREFVALVLGSGTRPSKAGSFPTFACTAQFEWVANPSVFIDTNDYVQKPATGLAALPHEAPRTDLQRSEIQRTPESNVPTAHNHPTFGFFFVSQTLQRSNISGQCMFLHAAPIAFCAFINPTVGVRRWYRKGQVRDWSLIAQSTRRMSFSRHNGKRL
jgi:hypothetical protein